MIPIVREVFWGPMAYAMIGGIIIATLLKLLVLPALYVAWYKIKEPNDEERRKHQESQEEDKQLGDDDSDEGASSPAH